MDSCAEADVTVDNIQIIPAQIEANCPLKL